MRRIKIKFNYGNEFRVFDATLAVVEQLHDTGFVLALGQMELERYIFLAPGSYIARVTYDLPGEHNSKKTCLIEHQFLSEEVTHLSFNFKKPGMILPGFSQPELSDLEGILKSTIGGRVNARSEQTFAINMVKDLGSGASLEERVVIDKNGKVEYVFSYNDQEPNDDNQPAKSLRKIILPATEEGFAESTVRFFSSIIDDAELPSPRPYTVHALNYGHWNIDLYGLNANISAADHGYRNLHSIVYLRPRAEVFNRLPNFIMENMAVARRINGLSDS